MIIISDEDKEKETEKERGDEIERGWGVGQGERNRERGRNGKHFFLVSSISLHFLEWAFLAKIFPIVSLRVYQVQIYVFFFAFNCLLDSVVDFHLSLIDFNSYLCNKKLMGFFFCFFWVRRWKGKSLEFSVLNFNFLGLVDFC